MTLFSARQISVRYGAVRALESVDIDVEAGTIHGVIGPNGAGKSTFIDALSGRTKLTAGDVLLDGESIVGRSVVWRRKHGITRSFQRTSIFATMTVRRQLEMVAHHNDETDLNGIVDVLGLEPVMDQPCSEIAYGTQRLVDLAIALCGRPRVVLLDEPCAGLVAAESEQMLGHVRSLCVEREFGVVLVEHDVDGVFRVCDQVTVLNLGSVLASGDPADVRADPQVIRAYLGSAA